jgi:hypothetical protein
MPLLHLYGLIPLSQDQRLIFDVTGVEKNHPAVYTLRTGNLAAVVSQVETPNYQNLDRISLLNRLVAHQRVIETVMADYPVLPIKFGNVLENAQIIEKMLTEHHDRLQNLLHKMADQVQIELVVLWNVQEMLTDIGEQPEIKALKAQISNRPETETMNERIALGKMVKAELDTGRREIQNEVVQEVQALAVDIISNPLMDDNMVTNLALLVEKKNLHHLELLVHELDAQFSGTFTFRYVGPLPPHSFATLNIIQPKFADIEAARTLLNLGQTATLADIKKAYHHQASTYHPDRNPNPETTTIAELNAAYRLLSTFAKHQSQSPIEFSPERINNSVLIHIEGQEEDE